MTTNFQYQYLCKVPAVIPCEYYKSNLCQETCGFAKLQKLKENKLEEKVKW